MITDLAAYREEMTREGEAYEEWLASLLRSKGRHVIRYTTPADQLAHGDLCVDGVNHEVKFQRELDHYERLFIETHELARNGQYVWSGLFATADWKFLITGDYHRHWRVHREPMKNLAKRMDRGNRIIEGKRGLSYGFLVSVAAMDRIQREGRTDWMIIKRNGRRV